MEISQIYFMRWNIYEFTSIANKMEIKIIKFDTIFT